MVQTDLNGGSERNGQGLKPPPLPMFDDRRTIPLPLPDISKTCTTLLLTNTKAYMGKKQSRIGVHLYFFFVCIIITPILMCGCSHFNKGLQAKSTFKEANDFFSQGNYKASLSKYEQIIEKYPTEGDRVLLE